MKMRVKIGEQTFEVELGDLDARPVLATIAGERFEVYPEDELVLAQAPAAPAYSPSPAPARPAPAAPAAAAGNGNAGSSRSVSAPIPGVIISISVQPGDTVSHGQELCMLEAMKMKNAIRSTRGGTIAAVRVAVGDHVRHGQPLVEFTD